MTLRIPRYVAVPIVLGHICFLAYGSQWLFARLPNASLSQQESLIFNVLVGCCFSCYLQTCCTRPGWVPKGWSPKPTKAVPYHDFNRDTTEDRGRWCRKCDASKPPRTHHCKICARCVSRMDHHCPWTGTCIAHRTLPHFTRFLFYGSVTLCHLEKLLWARAAIVWRLRDRPSHMGPSVTHLSVLTIFLLVCPVTLILIGILCAKTFWSLGANVTTIEGWEIERHASLVQRAKRKGGVLEVPDGSLMAYKHQEFPYDVGILNNIRQGLGCPLLLSWFPIGMTPHNTAGLEFETNGFDDEPWPPPDPQRNRSKPMIRSRIRSSAATESISTGFLRAQDRIDNDQRLAEFRIRQSYDQAQRPRVDHAGTDNICDDFSWLNDEGESMEDYGVDADS